MPVIDLILKPANQSKDFRPDLRAVHKREQDAFTAALIAPEVKRFAKARKADAKSKRKTAARQRRRKNFVAGLKATPGALAALIPYALLAALVIFLFSSVLKQHPTDDTTVDRQQACLRAQPYVTQASEKYIVMARQYAHTGHYRKARRAILAAENLETTQRTRFQRVCG